MPKTVFADSDSLELQGLGVFISVRNLFLVHQLQPWHVNLGSRQIKSPKLYVVDSGLLAFLIGANEARVTTESTIAGKMLESFVAMELLRQSDWASEPLSLFHYRDKEQREVDVVLERNSGEIVGIEVKICRAFSL